MGIIQIEPKSVPPRALFRKASGYGGSSLIVSNIDKYPGIDIIYAEYAVSIPLNKLVTLTTNGLMPSEINVSPADGLTLEDGEEGDIKPIALKGLIKMTNSFGKGDLLFLGPGGDIMNFFTITDQFFRQVIGFAIDNENIYLNIGEAEKVLYT